MKILVINGPNLNFLGIREKGIYGSESYDTLIARLRAKAEAEGIELECFQDNSEGAIIDRIQKAYFDEIDGIIINPGAYAHYSIAIRDALASVTVPKIEVHISNVYKREEFRHTSVVTPVCDGEILGLGLNGYLLAMDAMKELCKNK
ncbi:MAG: type II 3-dehydroquinate dehydratase [Lachnospiraceae bacterium]|nr:type II 3-dehydroquinate dehydratase [Lachnospiraceae bacterium]